MKAVSFLNESFTCSESLFCKEGYHGNGLFLHPVSYIFNPSLEVVPDHRVFLDNGLRRDDNKKQRAARMLECSDT